MRRRGSSTVLFALLLLVVTAGAAHAQADAGAKAACPDGRISFVFIDNNSIFDTSDPDLDARFRWAYRAANALHVRTRQWVIRRELLFRPGDCYDPFLLAESERVLRAYPFLAQVDIYGVPQTDGSHHVIVDTHDDWSTRVDLRVRVDRNLRFEGLRLSEYNFLGMGQEVTVFWQEREVTRDYGLTYFSPQIGRTRWDLTSAVGRTRAGSFFREQIGYPFLGEIGHWAGREGYSRNDQFFDYITRDDAGENAAHALLPVRSESFEASLLRRFGDRGRSLQAGVGLARERLRRIGTLQLAPDGHFDERIPADSATAAPIAPQTMERDALRVHLLVGARDVHWIKRRGLDSMRGEEDVHLGVEAGFDVGRSLPALAHDDDMTLSLLTYSAFASGPALVIARARGDGLRHFGIVPDEVRWQDLYGEAELFSYLRFPALPRQTLLLRADAAAARHTRTPFQLTLGGERGVRGYDIERFPGGRRLVFTLEDRVYIGWPLKDVFDSGLTFFADAGRMWPGDSPFGTDSGWRSSLGFGLRTSFPAGSRTTYRLDFAWPLDRGGDAGRLQVRLTIGELIGIGNSDNDFQFRRSRPDGIAGDLFRFNGSARS